VIDLGHLLLQLVVILVTARLVGRAFRIIGQPQVIGEMAAGLALGPSLLGAVAPGTLARLFPQDSLAPLSALSQLGVLLFMFVVGLRLDLQLLRGRARAAVFTSNASIALPFVMGAALAPWLHASLAPDGVPLLPFALFLGAAMSVTAFPVLARILTERGLLGTRIGSVAIAAAAVDDVTAWCILAAVVAVARSAPEATSIAWREFLVTIVSSGTYVVLAATAGRRLLARLDRELARRGILMNAQLVSGAIILALASAWVTERLGIHALFGAFLAGTVMPRTSMNGAPSAAQQIADRMEDVVGSVFLPVFFALTGLRTSVGLLDSPGLWAACAAIFAVAVSGKLGGSAAAARLAGMSWRDALSIGALMNTRGLMELVILNVGLEIGVISPALFTMMVLMALATTVMTSPLLLLLLRDEPSPAALQPNES
jgi:Kef-type K+ transport system membrane component KefB